MSGVVEGLCGVVEGLSGVVEGLSGVVEGLSGVVEGLSGVVEGLCGVVEGLEWLCGCVAVCMSRKMWTIQARAAADSVRLPLCTE